MHNKNLVGGMHLEDQKRWEGNFKTDLTEIQCELRLYCLGIMSNNVNSHQQC
jgi:hypothetical protein